MNSLYQELSGNYARPKASPPLPRKRPELTAKKLRNQERFYKLSRHLSHERIAAITGFHVKTVKAYLRERKRAKGG